MSENNLNHEFLFIYDAELCNPNGDPDNENKPRMDEERGINLISDVRLKRYIRDYLEFKGNDIYVSKVDGETKTATERINSLFANSKATSEEKAKYEEFQKIAKKKNKNQNEKIQLKKLLNDIKKMIPNKLIDIRLFGATIPLKADEGSGSSIIYTGPLQISWGYSLNPVKVYSFPITSQLSSESGKAQGSMGYDHRVKYSLIAFYGNIIAKKCEHTNLTEDDIKLFDEAIIKSIPLLATRSKINQFPRLYIRLAYNSDMYLYGDLRKLVKIELNDAAQKNGVKLDTIKNTLEIKLDTTELTKIIDELKTTKLQDDKGNPTDLSTLNSDKSVFYKSNDLQINSEIIF